MVKRPPRESTDDADAAPAPTADSRVGWSARRADRAELRLLKKARREALRELRRSEPETWRTLP